MASPPPREVLVTGATGLAGSHTVKALLAAGHRVRAFVRSPEKAARIFGEPTASLSFARGDIGDRDSVERALEGVDGVVHAAAIVEVKGLTPEALIETNVAGVHNVVGGAVAHGIERIVYVSSVASLLRPGVPTTITADTEPHDSVHAYGQSKVLAERYARELQAEGKPVKITYPTAIVGPDDPGLTESMNALRIFADVIVVLTTSGFQLVDARDLADAHVRLLEAPPGPGRYVVAGHFLPWHELADLLDAIEGTRVRRLRCPPSLLLGSGRVLDVLRRMLPIEFPLTYESSAYVTGWSPIESSPELFELGVRLRGAEETLRDCVAWLRAAGHM